MLTQIPEYHDQYVRYCCEHNGPPWTPERWAELGRLDRFFIDEQNVVYAQILDCDFCTPISDPERFGLTLQEGHRRDPNAPFRCSCGSRGLEVFPYGQQSLEGRCGSCGFTAHIADCM